LKVLTPLWFLDVLDASFAFPLMKSISEQLGLQPEPSLYIAYINGQPKQEWKQHFSFRKLTMPYGFVRSKMMRFFLSRRKLYNQVKTLNVDVIFTLSDLWAQEFARYCSRKMRIPYVVRLRGDHREVRKSMGIGWIKDKPLDYLEIRSLRNADLVIPNSMRLAKKAETWGIKKEKITQPLWNGVDTQMFKPMRVDRTNTFTVAYAGRISPEKRVHHLMKIAEKLKETHFLIAGRKQMEVTFPSNAEYLGELRFSEMPKFYNKADLIVLPSLTEGFPNAVLEAYACGKPILATKESFPEELKVFGSVVDINKFESEIRALKSSDLKTLGRKAKAYVEKEYSWERFSRSIVTYFRTLLSEKVDANK